MFKYTQTIRRHLPTNRLSVFDHFVGLALKKLSKRGEVNTLQKVGFFGGNDKILSLGVILHTSLYD